MKKVFKWIWYNKEQLLSIFYNVVAIVLSNIVMWTDTLNGYVETLAQVPVFAHIGGDMAVKATAVVLSIGFAILTIRNVCVKYGLSDLDTIDKVLAERAAKKQNKLTAEQKKEYKGLITLLKGELVKATNDVKTAETELANITKTYTADNSLVSDFVIKRQTYEKKIANSKANIISIEEKIAEYKAILNGTKSANK